MLSENQRRLILYASKVSKFKPETPPPHEMFIVAGGPSLKTMDLSGLPPERTIAINRAFEIVNAKYIYIMDDRMVKWVLADEFKSRDKFLSPSVTRIMPSPLAPPEKEKIDFPVKYVLRSLDKIVALPGHLGMFCGCNSGFGSIQLASWMGVKKIYLLGYDMHSKGGTHFHNGYKTTPTERYDHKLMIFRKELEWFAPKFQQAGIEIVNLTPDSALTCFPKDDLKNILKMT